MLASRQLGRALRNLFRTPEEHADVRAAGRAIVMREALDLWRIAQDPSCLAGVTPLPKQAFAA